MIVLLYELNNMNTDLKNNSIWISKMASEATPTLRILPIRRKC